MIEFLLEGGNKEQNALEELLKNSLQNDLVLERLNSQMREMLEALEVQKASEVNDSQEPSLEVKAEILLWHLIKTKKNSQMLKMKG